MEKKNSQKIQEELSRLPRCTPAWLATIVSGKQWEFQPHLQLIDQALVNAANGKAKRIIINMPPRHGKSELISKYFPFWYLGNYPDKRIMLTSYGSEFATSWGKKVRDMIDIYGNIMFDVQIDKSSRSAHDFKLENHQGGMNCIGAGGSITGKGADLMIIDDPVKNDAEANSKTIRDSIWEWYTTTAYTRLEPDGVLIIIMTRWHEDDLCGRIIREEGINFKQIWTYINLPAIAEENDILSRKPGEALWKKRFSIEKLEEIKKTIGNYWFSSLYQQRPSTLEGGIFNIKHFRYFSEKDGVYILHSDTQQKYIKNKCHIYAVMDLAASVKETADYTVLIVFAVTEHFDILILDVFRERVEGAEHLKLVERTYHKWNPISIGIESVQYQIALVQSAKRKGVPVKALYPDKDKVSRSLAIAARMEAGSVYFREQASWLATFEDELLHFPNATHDDQVDAFAYCATMIKPISNTLPASLNRRNEHRLGITNGF